MKIKGRIFISKKAAQHLYSSVRYFAVHQVWHFFFLHCWPLLSLQSWSSPASQLLLSEQYTTARRTLLIPSVQFYKPESISLTVPPSLSHKSECLSQWSQFVVWSRIPLLSRHSPNRAISVAELLLRTWPVKTRYHYFSQISHSRRRLQCRCGGELKGRRKQ